MNLIGHGIDLVENARIARAMEQHGEAFLARVFLPPELEYCRKMRDPAPHFAARWAAKEALAKAFGTGIGASIGFSDIEIRRKASGEPFVVLHGAGGDLAKRRGVATILLSLSHTAEHAMASVILVGK